MLLLCILNATNFHLQISKLAGPQKFAVANQINTKAPPNDLQTPPVPLQPSTPSPDEVPADGYYRRPLPARLVAFSSAEGRTIFREALLSVGPYKLVITFTHSIHVLHSIAYSSFSKNQISMLIY